MQQTKQIQNSPMSGGGQEVRLRSDEKPVRLSGKKAKNRLNRKSVRY